MLALGFGHDGFSRNTLTRLLILLYLGVTLAIGCRYRPSGGARLFIGVCLASSLMVEFFYMFSRPVFPQLLINAGDSLAILLHKTRVLDRARPVQNKRFRWQFFNTGRV